MPNLTIGQPYKKRSFNIFFPASLKSDHIVAGELYSFFNDEGGKDDNIRRQDSFIYEVHANYQLIPPGGNTNLHRHIFIRLNNSSDYEYFGESYREENYSTYQNEAFLRTNNAQEQTANNELTEEVEEKVDKINQQVDKLVQGIDGLNENVTILRSGFIPNEEKGFSDEDPEKQVETIKQQTESIKQSVTELKQQVVALEKKILNSEDVS